MANEENLKPFKKGKDPRRNTTGKNKGCFSLKRKLLNQLKEIDKSSGETYGNLVIKATTKDGIKVDGQSRRLIWQYIDGMPQQNVDVTSDNKPISIYAGQSIQGHDSNSKDIQSKQKD